MTMGARRIFSRGRQIRGPGNKSSAEFGAGAPAGVWGQSPQKPTKNCENNA